MKTEKELKDELEDIFFDALTDKSNPPYYTDKVDPENDGRWQWKVYELCADELIKRGYGDVSEYKAEIERLKAENDANMQYIRMMGIQSHIKTSNEKIKQAKIDVLNELKTHSYYDDDYMDSYVFVSDIDELIKEVQNGKDKG